MSDDDILTLLWKRLGIEEEAAAIRKDWDAIKASARRDPGRFAKAIARGILEKGGGDGK
jgi:hypothetical protein